MKNFTSKDISRIKNITNGETGKAYLNLEEKEFILHFPDKRKNSILEAKTDEIVVLYQRASKSKPRYLTHLVRAIDYEIIEENTRENFKYGRIFEVIAYTGEENKINFELTELGKIDFRNRGWGNAESFKNIANQKTIEKIQVELWNLFKPYFNHKLKQNLKDYQTYFNDELEQDFGTKEGKELFRKHRVRERDSSLTYRKKQIAIKNGNLECEVCNFSFQDIYEQDYIECHHKTPIFKGERITKLEDLALVCSNCHRMLHRRIEGDFLSLEQLRKRIKTRHNTV
ncbi:putative HNH restriction endonuclease [Wenyingzhuangia heitensis]|uniref:HNH restriction endonuclease n=1 Tax=Wenyingzhuangia heitensis TaxID=1487859 RepID=A0ABX0UCK2_9FLAO|nr:HNH endonuclease [Wenyingzhuangia heitensis]NIJ45276.1 putative HNH restriction endonuclease [Wenyingzhuangia heitensis]